VPDSHFEAGLGVMGPILAATDGEATLLLAYEHGSQAPDAFVRFDLAPAAASRCARSRGATGGA
jgi:alpha-galactosidase